jgi:hypothetical protein
MQIDNINVDESKSKSKSPDGIPLLFLVGRCKIVAEVGDAE